jgi:hypothetical protein
LITMEVVERFISENIDAVGSIGVGMDTCEWWWHCLYNHCLIILSLSSSWQHAKDCDLGIATAISFFVISAMTWEWHQCPDRGTARTGPMNPKLCWTRQPSNNTAV